MFSIFLNTVHSSCSIMGIQKGLIILPVYMAKMSKSVSFLSTFGYVARVGRGSNVLCIHAKISCSCVSLTVPKVYTLCDQFYRLHFRVTKVRNCQVVFVYSSTYHIIFYIILSLWRRFLGRWAIAITVQISQEWLDANLWCVCACN